MSHAHPLQTNPNICISTAQGRGISVAQQKKKADICIQSELKCAGSLDMTQQRHLLVNPSVQEPIPSKANADIRQTWIGDGELDMVVLLSSCLLSCRCVTMCWSPIYVLTFSTS